ncbi:L-lactate permease [Nitrospinota bacterium]
MALSPGREAMGSPYRYAPDPTGPGGGRLLPPGERLEMNIPASGPELTAASFVLALSPIFALIVLMLGLGWGGSRAGPAGLLIASVVAWSRFGAGGEVIVHALVRGVLISLPVLYIIVPALLLYHVAEAAGGIRNIGWCVWDMTQNHILQLMILAFGFTSFLQGVAGFGVPVAVVAPLLVGIGYPPVQAVAASLIGHAWAVSLGDMASSFQALLSVTDLPPTELAVLIASLLGLSGFAAAISIAHLHAGWSAVFRWPLIILLLGGLTSLAQFVLAWLKLWIVASFGAGMICLLVGFGLSRFRRYQLPSRPPSYPPKPEGERVRLKRPPDGTRRMSFHLAFSPYYALVIVVMVATFVPFIHDILHHWRIEIPLKALRTSLGFLTPPKTWKIEPFGHPGALLLCTSYLGYLTFRAKGCWPGKRAALFRNTFREAVPTSVGTVSMVAMASVMTVSGMIQVMAEGVAAFSGGLFPLFAPLVGLLGCFVTGSNTNANILFGKFQVSVGEVLGKNPVVLAAGNSAGGSLGSMVAPAKVLVGCSTAGLAGREGEVFRRVGSYCAVQVAMVGLLTYWLAL